jgi:hypothetical protein
MTFSHGSPFPLCHSLGHDWYLSGVSNGEVTLYADYYRCTRCDAICPASQESSERTKP